MESAGVETGANMLVGLAAGGCAYAAPPMPRRNSHVRGCSRPRSPDVAEVLIRLVPPTILFQALPRKSVEHQRPYQLMRTAMRRLKTTEKCFTGLQFGDRNLCRWMPYRRFGGPRSGSAENHESRRWLSGWRLTPPPALHSEDLLPDI